MSDKKHIGRTFGARGYYIALILCAAAIGITSYVYYRNEETPEEVLLQQEEYIPAGTMEVQADVPVLATQPQTEDTQSRPEAQPTQPTVKKALQTQAPVSGQEIGGYSMEALSYNQTTRDWRVHNGVDISAEEGTPVCAAAEGTVQEVFEDETLGHTVVIRHDGGYTTRYASLQEDLAVSAGDAVALGQTIGYAGSTALVETGLGSHVHFSVTCQGKAMDPAEFLALGQ